MFADMENINAMKKKLLNNDKNNNNRKGKDLKDDEV
jgi:hypothetical protein